VSKYTIFGAQAGSKIT